MVESWQWWMVGDTFLTISLAGCADFTVSYFHFHFHFPAKKSVQKGEVGSDPRAGYFFQRHTHTHTHTPTHTHFEMGGRCVSCRSSSSGSSERAIARREFGLL